MKKFITLLALILITSAIYPQEAVNDTIATNVNNDTTEVTNEFDLDNTVVKDLVEPISRADSLIIRRLDELAHYANLESEFEFKLYPTKNMYTFLELDTRTGRIWQVHWDTKSGGRQKVVLNDIELIYMENYTISGRFELYPTENIYNFILLDKYNGRTWQVQWDYKIKYRGVWRIE